MIIISLACYPCGVHQAAPEEILQKRLCSFDNHDGINVSSSLGNNFEGKRLRPVHTLSTSTSKGNVRNGGEESLHGTGRKKRGVF